MDDLMSGVKVPVVSRKKLENNTILWVDEDGAEHYRLHDTDVVVINEGRVILNSGGWRTVTTKDRMNKYLPPGWSVYSDKGVWYLYHGDDKIPYEDGMVINLMNGVVVGCGSEMTVKKELAWRKQVTKFVKKLDKVPMPRAGDCFYCQCQNPNEDCIRSHVKEGYLHGSLVYNAVKWSGYNEQYLMELPIDSVRRSLKRFILANTGSQA
jgi:hypothetical protein